MTPPSVSEFPRTQNAPLIPIFIAVIVGIFTDAVLSPGRGGWLVVIAFASLMYLASKATSFILVRRVPETRYYFDNCAFLFKWSFVNKALYLLLFGGVWLWLIVCAIAGIRHDAYYNCFPEREIGLHIPEKGVASIVELRVLKTATLRTAKEHNTIYGDDDSTSFQAEILRAQNGGVWEEYSGRVLATVSGDARFLRIGDVIRAPGRLGRPRRPDNPGDFDRRFYYRAQRVLTTFYIESPDCIDRLKGEPLPLKYRLLRRFERIRLSAVGVLRESLSERNASVAVGMTFGFRNDVDESTNESFRRTGTIHLLAISGLHVALVIGAFVFLLRRLGAPVAVVSVLTIALVLFYLALTDARTPIIRASFLTIVYSVGVLIHRRGVALNTLVAAAILLLFWNPCELFQMGAQLSFLATGTFLWIDANSLYDKSLSNDERWRAIKERRLLKLSRRQAEPESPSDTELSFWQRVVSLHLRPLAYRLGKWLWGKSRALIKVGVIIWLVGTPLILRQTNLFTPIAIIANPLIWLPATCSLLSAFLLAFVGVAADCAPGCFGWLVPGLGWICNLFYDVFLKILDAMASPSWGAIHVPTPNVWTLWLFYLPLVLWTLFPTRRPSRAVLVAFVMLLASAVIVERLYSDVQIARSQKLRIDVFSVGHGLAVLGVFPDGRVFLYDCGSMTNSDRAAEIVAKNLWNYGKTQIDLAIISHADFDHYGGFERLAQLVTIKDVCVSPVMFKKDNRKLQALRDALDRNGARIVQVVGRSRLSHLGFNELEVLHPTPNDGETFLEESNANSLVVSLDFLGRRFLFPGDLDTDEALFLDSPNEKYDLALAPHHGGKTVNFRDFYDWSDPDWVVISGGGFLRSPASEQTLWDEGRIVVHSADEGATQIVVERDANSRESKTGVMTIGCFRTNKSSVASSAASL